MFTNQPLCQRSGKFWISGRKGFERKIEILFFRSGAKRGKIRPDTSENFRFFLSKMTLNDLPLRSKKAGRFQKLFDFARSTPLLHVAQ